MSNDSSNFDSDKTLEFRVATTFAAAIFMSFCCVVGIFGNITSAAIFLHPLMRSPINILLAGLSLIDLCMIFLSVFVLVIPSLNLLIQDDHLWRGYALTTMILYPLCTASHTSSIWTFVLVSVERYMAICNPLKRHKLLTCRQAKLAQVCVVVVALCYNAVRVWEYKFATNTNSQAAAGGVEPNLRLRFDYFIGYYTVLYILTHFVAPFSIILILNIFIVRSIRCTDRFLREGRGGAHAQTHQSRHTKQQRRTTRMIVVITCMFAVCNLCPFILNVWEALDPMLFYGHLKIKAYVALDVSNTLVIFNSSATVIIYIIYCRKYRVLFKYYIKCFCLSETSAGSELALDPGFRRYSVITISACGDAGFEVGAAAYAIINKRKSRGQFLSFDGSCPRLDPLIGRSDFRNRSASTLVPIPDFRDRFYTR